MSYSSGTRNALFEGLGWLVAAGCVVAAVSLFDFGELRGAVMAAARSQHASKPASANAATRPSDEAGATARAMGVVELKMQGDGHYHADAEINGRSVSVLVDTGATLVAMSYEDAESAGIYVKPSDYTAISRTANGTARFAPVTIDRISIDGIMVRGVQAAVAEPGKLSVTLLGMAFLSKLNRVEMRDGRLLLQE